MKLQEAIKEFLRDLKDLGRSPATITAYSKDLEQLANSTGDLDVREISANDISEFVNKLDNKNFTNKTISRKLNSTKSLFKFLHEKKKIKKDPSKEIPHPEITIKPPRILTKQEYSALRETARGNNRLYTLIELMIQTGIRIGEVSRLKLEDVQLTSKPGQIVIKKFASSPTRVVEVNPYMLNVLENYLSTRKEVKEDQNFVFNTKNGGPMIIRNIRSAINRMFKKAEIKDVTVNDIRNTFIVYQLESGVSLAKVAQTVGHKRFSSTEKYLPLLKRNKLGRGERIVEL